MALEESQPRARPAQRHAAPERGMDPRRARFSEAEARAHLVREALRDLDLLAHERPGIWLPDRDALELSLCAMLMRGMLGRLYFTFYNEKNLARSDGPVTHSILLEVAYTFLLDGTPAPEEEGLASLAPDLPALLAPLPIQALFCPFVEWTPRWVTLHPAEGDQLRILQRLPGLRWEGCGLRLLRPMHVQAAGRAARGQIAVARAIYARGG